MIREEAMTAESTKIWRCPSCNRLLVEKSVAYAKARHEEMLSRTRGASLEFVREATWPAYLASLKRCRCGEPAAAQACAGGLAAGAAGPAGRCGGAAMSALVLIAAVALLA